MTARSTPARPAPRRISCPLCQRADVELQPSGRLVTHPPADRSRGRCAASNLDPADVAPPR